MLAEVRSGAWRAVARALRLSGSQNFADVQIEPAQPVLELGPEMRYGAGNLVQGAGARDYGWVAINCSFSIGGAADGAAGIFPFGVGVNPADSVFWIYEAYVSVFLSTLTEFERGALYITGTPALTSTTGQVRTILQGGTLGVFDPSTSAGLIAGSIQNEMGPNVLPRPVPLHIGEECTVRVERNAAAGAEFDVIGTAIGRYLPTGTPPW